jgi:RimJ/RimL family protein N-acetyltransferase
MSEITITLRQADQALVHAVADGRRPENGWAEDFPTEGDLAGLQMSRFDPNEHEPWSSSYLILVDDVISGTIGFKGAPNEHGEAEIGYGVVRSRQGRGVASAALSLLLDLLEGRSLEIVAETAHWNVASQTVLEKSGFLRAGERRSREDGDLIVWRRHVD